MDREGARQPWRLPQGGRIDRTRPLRFTYDGRSHVGYGGDTLASALLANGVRLTARSFKYHRPRGIVGMGTEEPASLVELLGAEADGNRQITTVALREGLTARPVNCWPSARFDLGAAAQLIAPLLPAGFYYKTFIWPGWRFYEPFIRRAAGLARAPMAATEAQSEVRNAHADLIIVGAGPAGLMAALVAGRAGVRVLLADEGTEPGGALLSRRLSVDGLPGADWAASVAAELAAMPHVTLLRDASVWAYREHNLLMVHERSPPEPGLLQRGWRVRARQVILATGAAERMLVLPGNDRPGVMLASAAQAYANRWAVRPGARAVVFANNDSAYAAAADLAAAGVEVAAIADARADVPASARAQCPGIEILAATHVTRTHGARQVRAVSLRPAAGGPERRIACDLLALSGGWNPAVQLFAQSRGMLGYDGALAAFLPGTPAQPCRCAGAAGGHLTLPEALADGAAKARAALADMGIAAPALAPPGAVEAPYAIEPLWSVPGGGAGQKSFVDLQNDVTLADIGLAMREGYGAPEHAKRYTTAGMGFDQGRTGNVNVLGILAGLAGTGPEALGPTTFRAPVQPVPFGAIAGHRVGPVALPYRHTPLTGWAIERGAVMYEAGARWRRPGYFPRPGEGLTEAAAREARAVRLAVGVYDGSPLGTFALTGPDSARFLDFLCTARIGTLRPGEGRYTLMLSDDGLILDDGVAFRLGAGRFLLSSSTGNADAMHQHMQRLLRIERPEWQVRLTVLTGQWANATLCGPQARAVLTAAGTDIDLDPAAFPFMALREGRVAGIPARIARVSFTGELSFEINVWPRHLPALWEAILRAGAPYGIEPVGSEANHILRVEKGFLSLGHEVDGTADPHDLGMGWAMARAKGDYLGRRSVALRRAAGGPRRELVGLLPIDPERPLPEGAPLTPEGRREGSEGFVTACVRSVVLNRWIGLALLADGRARIGGRAHVRLPGGAVEVAIAPPVFVDPHGSRMRG